MTQLTKAFVGVSLLAYVALFTAIAALDWVWPEKKREPEDDFWKDGIG